MKNLLNEITELTDWNDHTTARIRIAEFFGFEHFVQIFELIKKIQDTEKCIPHNVFLYREEKTMEMLKLLKPDTLSKINKCL